MTMSKLIGIGLISVVVLCLAPDVHASGFQNRKKSPLTTKGDIYAHDGTSDIRLPVGAVNGYVLSADSSTSSGLRWGTIGGGSGSGTITGGTNLGTGSQVFQGTSGANLQFRTIVSGDRVTMTVDANTITIGANVGSLGTQQASNVTISGGSITGITDLAVADGGTGASSHTDGAILLGDGTGAITNTGVLTKGVLIVGDGTTDPTLLSVGTNGMILSADSAQTSGVKWASIPSYDRGVVVAMSDGATITPNLDLGKVFTVTLGGARTLGTPINGIDGHSYIFIISQDATGSRTLGYSPFYRFGTDVTSPTLSTTAGRNDYIGMVYKVRGNKKSMDVVAVSLGYAD